MKNERRALTLSKKSPPSPSVDQEMNNYKGLQVITAVMIRTCMGVGCNYYEFQLLLLETRRGWA
eukprot:COSAG02_NODE_398_length_23118_cov_49.968939_23_plen_64_part_00